MNPGLKQLGLSAVAVAALLPTGALAGHTSLETGGANAERSVRVQLHPINGSHQSAVAILTPTSTGYTVVVKLSGKRIEPGEHDHIHNLTCARYSRIAPHPYAPTAIQIDRQLATIRVGLDDIYHGRSRTRIPSPLSQVTRGGFSINVHEADGPYTALACGDIPAIRG